MSRVIALFKGKKPRCEAQVSDTTERFNRELHRRKPSQCSLSASYEIDGKKLCARHAGKVALEILAGVLTE